MPKLLTTDVLHNIFTMPMAGDYKPYNPFEETEETKKKKDKYEQLLEKKSNYNKLNMKNNLSIIGQSYIKHADAQASNGFGDLANTGLNNVMSWWNGLLPDTKNAIIGAGGGAALGGLGAGLSGKSPLLGMLLGGAAGGAGGYTYNQWSPQLMSFMNKKTPEQPVMPDDTTPKPDNMAVAKNTPTQPKRYFQT